ncbi:MAG: hypothetical protein CM15mV105_200 [uncultured marine virus]|nr:MAG: hypothetical protein CM15mV105_200 [uncultured marine virus]
MDIRILTLNFYYERIFNYDNFKVKKVWFTIAAIVIPAVARALGVTEDAVSEIFWALVTLTGAQGVADLGKGAVK